MSGPYCTSMQLMGHKSVFPGQSAPHMFFTVLTHIISCRLSGSGIILWSLPCTFCTAPLMEATEQSEANLRGNTNSVFSPICTAYISKNCISQSFCVFTVSETNALFTMCTNNDKCSDSTNQLCILIESINLARQDLFSIS